MSYTEMKQNEKIGQRFINSYKNDYVIKKEIEVISKTGRKYKKYLVDFEEYNYQTTATYQNCQLGRVACPYDKRYAGVACIGLNEDGTEPITHINSKPTRAYNLWTAMINRVYSKSQLKHHPGYKKSKVCDRWLVFAHFLKDLPNIPNYELWLKDGSMYQLDKDLLQPGKEYKVYSPETVIFVPKNVNVHLIKHNVKKEKTPKPKKKIRLTHIETGMIMDFKKQQEVAKHLGITQSHVSRIMNGTRKFEGYKIEKIYE